MKKNEEKKKKTKDMVYGKLIDMFDLVLEMASKTEGMTLKEIQAKMGCSNRTAKRIINMLNCSFFDLVKKKSEINPREYQYKINRSKVIDYLTNITTDEIKSLRLAKVILEDNNLYDEAKKLSKINDKILNSYKYSQKLRCEVDVDALIESQCFIYMPRPKIIDDPEVLKQIKNAILEVHKLRFLYEYEHKDENTGEKITEKKVKTVRPYGIIYGERNHYLVSKEPNQPPKQYIISKMKDAEILKESFNFEKEFNISDFAKESFGAWHGDTITTTWEFSKEVADEARRFIFHPNETHYDTEDGKYVVTFTAAGILEMGWHLKMWGNSVKVIEPEDFWDQVAEAQARCDGLYKPSASDKADGSSKKKN